LTIQANLIDWNANDEFFEFTRGRFVRDESDQLARRRVKFDMNELTCIAAQAVGASSCIKVVKCPDGMYNKSFLMLMDDGQEVISICYVKNVSAFI
jgi:hypothetical protein